LIPSDRRLTRADVDVALDREAARLGLDAATIFEPHELAKAYTSLPAGDRAAARREPIDFVDVVVIAKRLM
jgi:hypothetical protein